MGKGAGSGLLGFGIVLTVVGAIMRFAITADSDGFNIETVGLILLFAGIAMAVIGLLLLVFGGRQSTTTRESVQQTPEGQQRVQKQENWTAPS
ncbi:MAG: hypothetical protein WEA10_00320 [Actinomycetota bacterium]